MADNSFVLQPICFLCNTKYTSKIKAFYSSYHPMYKFNDKRAVMCKSCANTIYKKYVKELGDKHLAFFYLCSRLGWYFSKKAFERANTDDASVIGNYSKEMNIGECKGKSFEDNVFEDMLVFASSVADMKELAEEEKASSVKKPEELSPENIPAYDADWAGTYTPNEVKTLNHYYANLLRDYKIATENHKDYAKKIAKASLYMDQCLEQVKQGDKGASTQLKQAQEIFDKLCQSAKFAESTRSVNDVGLGCFGRIAEEVEKGTYIYKHTPLEKDTVDEILAAFSVIEKSI